MKIEPLKTSCMEGAALPQKTIEEMWELRAQVMTLKPGVDKAQDFASFSGVCRRAQMILLMRDRGQVLRGMSVWLYQQREWQGRRFLDLLPEYWMIQPDWRGHPAAALAGARIGLRLLWASWGRSIVSVNAAYLQSYVKLAPLVDFWTLGDPDIPAWEKSYLIHAMGERFPGWTPAQSVVEMRTLPPPLSDRWCKAHEEDPAFRAYTAQNPRWQEGFALPAIAVTSWKLLRPVVAQSVRRSLRPWLRRFP